MRVHDAVMAVTALNFFDLRDKLRCEFGVVAQGQRLDGEVPLKEVIESKATQSFRR